MRFSFSTSVLLPIAAVAFVDPAGAQVEETATCKLTNVAKGAILYEGRCKVKQTQSGANTIFSIKMGSAQSFMFAGKKGSSEWMHGPERTQFTDLPNGGIFKWSDFALVVAED